MRLYDIHINHDINILEHFDLPIMLRNYLILR